MPKGRPVKSQVRQNMVEILFYLKSASGYDIYQIYKAVFPKVTLRLMYYHLKKGVSLGIFIIDRIDKVAGNYSWGPEAEKIYYSLGPNASPSMNAEIKKYIDTISTSKENNNTKNNS